VSIASKAKHDRIDLTKQTQARQTKMPTARTAHNLSEEKLIAFLRSHLILEGEEGISDAEWLQKHHEEVAGAGYVLQFLKLARPNRRTRIGWTATRKLDKLTTYTFSNSRRSTTISQNDQYVVDIVLGIAKSKIHGSRRYWCRIANVLSFCISVLQTTGLIETDEEEECIRPTITLYELLWERMVDISPKR
jgi:hypothetical protein